MMPKPSLEFDALGTHWWIELPENSDVEDIKGTLLNHVSSFENNYSRFLPNSYIGRLNTDKKLLGPSRELLDMLIFAQQMYMVSKGIFNISVGGTLARFGYGKSKTNAKLKMEFWDHIIMTEQVIRMPDDIELDFGGFGKGWLIDKLATLLEKEGCHYFVINGGGDIFVKSDVPVELALEHPLDDSLKIGTTRINHGALAVSSSVKRSWKQGMKKHHHLIDPRRGESSDSPIIATYVRADTALIADTMATILLIAPELRDSLTNQYNLQTILLNKEMSIKS